jgi:hypothetical protein
MSPVDFVEVKYGADIRMVQRGAQSGFTFESFEISFFGGQFRRQNFDDHRPAELDVDSFVDSALASGADLIEDFVITQSGANHSSCFSTLFNSHHETSATGPPPLFAFGLLRIYNFRPSHPNKIPGRQNLLMRIPTCNFTMANSRDSKLSLFALLICCWLLSAPANAAGQFRGWEWQNPRPQGNLINAIRFTKDKLHGWAVGADGAIMRTENGAFFGRNSSQTSSPPCTDSM